MPELTSFHGKMKTFNIAERIGIKYNVVGIALLNDESGEIVPAIKLEHKDNAEQISLDILSRWVQRKGIADRTWRGLLDVLSQHCPGLAQDIKDTLTSDGVSRKMSYGPINCSKHHYCSSCMHACFFVMFACRLWVKDAVQNGLLPLPLFVFQLRSIWDGLHVTSSKVRLQSLRTLCTVRGFPVVASYVAWRADQVLEDSYTLDIGQRRHWFCIFVQDRALGGEAKYGRPFEN